MRRALLIASLLAATMAVASAQLLTTRVGSGSTAGGGGCSNGLDFSQACNAIYAVVIIF